MPDAAGAHIAIGDALQRKAGKAIIKDYADLFLDPFAGPPTQDMARAVAVNVVHALRCAGRATGNDRCACHPRAGASRSVRNR